MSGAPDLSVALGPLRLRNPVLTASGTCGYGEELAPYFDVSKLGGIVTKSLSLLPRQGNAPQRLAETPSGMINSIGLQNVGIEAFLADKLPFLQGCGAAVLVSIFGATLDEFAELAARLDGRPGVSGLELNVSCPNTLRGGVEFGVDPESTRRVTAAVRERTKLPVIVKLSPNVTDLPLIARAALEGGADILSLVNTFFGMKIDVAARRPGLSSGSGGLSGPAIRPMAVHLTYRLARAVRAPIIGIGGIGTATDALEFILAGATAVQVGTATFVDPCASAKTVAGLADYCRAHGVGRISDLVGAAHRGVAPAGGSGG
ncbi:MAG TPA: dihydroorotate dehydrogenase [Verrucomicrobiae bacterium]|nr:dihydroorotate dehydrogenase [Verrucomicrobiae bacterium]